MFNVLKDEGMSDPRPFLKMINSFFLKYRLRKIYKLWDKFTDVIDLVALFMSQCGRWHRAELHQHVRGYRTLTQQWFFSVPDIQHGDKQQLADEHSSALYWSHMRPFLWTDKIRNVREKHLLPIPLQLPAAARPNNHNKCHSKVWKQHRFIKSRAKYHPVCTSWPQFCAPHIYTFFPFSLKAFFVLMAPFNLSSFRGPLFSPTRRERL